MILHRFDSQYHYCRRCGVALDAVMDGKRDVLCQATPNVVEISNELARRRFEPLVGTVSGPAQRRQP
jgi:hypothetical protein